MSAFTNEPSYDIIFAGGGACGCLTAGRLAAADPSLKILIVEAGETTHNDISHRQPARFLQHLLPTSTAVTRNIAKPNPRLNGRSVEVLTGRCVGGGSSVNFSMYIRAAASDYDDWATEFGNEGWHSDDLIPLLKKTETYQVEPNLPTHGYSGPLKISMAQSHNNIGVQYLEAAKYYKNRGQINDGQGLYEANSFSPWARWIDGETGLRSDVPHHFIYNQLHNKNLQLLTGKRVKRVIFEGDRAVGIEYVNDTIINPAADQTIHTARASKLVVVSGGAFGSPTILERSGIGGAALLSKLGINVKVDLPGVGDNYQDHHLATPTFIGSEDAETFDGLIRGKPGVEAEHIELFKQGKGLLASNGIDAGIKLRPTEEELKVAGPEFEERWKTFFANKPDKPVLISGTLAALMGDPSVVPDGRYYHLPYYAAYPVSTGSVHITSADDANALHDFDPNFLQHTADMATLRWAYKFTREIARRLDLYRGEYLPGNPVFPEGSEAACNAQASGPIPASDPPTKYTAEDDKAIDEFHRNFVVTSWHSSGTCAMKSRESGGVVDSKLNVYGVKGLKVADISILPQNVGANTYSTATVIAEKAAVIIAAELGIANV